MVVKTSDWKHKGSCILALNDNHNPKVLILLVIESNEWSWFGRLKTIGHLLVVFFFFFALYVVCLVFLLRDGLSSNEGYL